MKRFSPAIQAVAVLGVLLVSVAGADAQGRARGRAYAKTDVERIIKRVEERSDVFQKRVDRELDHSRLNGTRLEDRINAEVKQFERAVDELRAEFDRRDSWRETRSNVERVLRHSDDVNRVMRNSRFAPAVEREWAALRSELNTLAGVYNLKPLRS